MNCFCFLENTTSNSLMRKVDQVFGEKKCTRINFFEAQFPL